MHFLNKKLFLLLSLIAGNTALLGYEYDFNNWTEIPLLVMFERESSLSKDFQIIKPGEMIKHVWQGTEGGQCLRNTMKWAQWRESDTEYKKWASDRGRIPSEKQKAFGAKFLTQYAWSDLNIKMIPVATFEEMKKQAVQLVSGVKVIGKGLSTIVGAAGELAGSTLCKSRVFGIIDTGQKNHITRKPVLVAETGEGE